MAWLCIFVRNLKSHVFKSLENIISVLYLMEIIGIIPEIMNLAYTLDETLSKMTVSPTFLCL